MFTLPAVGGTPRKLLAWPEAPTRRPQWSRDGNEIAVVYGHGADLFMEILSLETQQTRQLPIGRRCMDSELVPGRALLGLCGRRKLDRFDHEPVAVSTVGGRAHSGDEERVPPNGAPHVW